MQNQQIDLTTLPVAPSLHYTEAFALWLHEQGRMPNTISAYLQDLRHYFRYFSEVNAVNVKSYFAMQDVDNTVKPTSRNRRLASLRVFVEWAVETGLLDADPTVSVKRQPVEFLPRDRSDDEMDRLNEVVRTGSHIRCAGESHAWLALRDRIIWHLHVDTGLRIGEVESLNADDLDFDAGTINVIGKGAKKARVKVPMDLMTMLASWISVLPASAHGALCVGWNSRRLTTGQIRRRLQMIGETAGIHDFKPHDIRHSYAYRLKATLIEQGLSEEKALDGVRRQLRHADVKMTFLYFRVRESQIRAAVEAM